MLLPANKQFEFWILRRKGFANIDIARTLNISRQAVSRALLRMDEKISKTLLEMAKANQIEVESLNPKYGILFGYSIPLKVNAIIFVSEKHGIQVWYEHEGDCNSCERYRQCMELLWDFADEMNIKLEKVANPTKLADELFEKLRRLYHAGGEN
ncbi:hypothetical protein DRP05_09075 [Archaeoglobales archaeon]|nr:MAG: hypothetical protein DRP05_09075 [Archaeoglobales archaeon]